MIRYRLRTLMIVLALGPPALAFAVLPLVAWLMSPAPRVIEKKPATSTYLIRRVLFGDHQGNAYEPLP